MSVLRCRHCWPDAVCGGSQPSRSRFSTGSPQSWVEVGWTVLDAWRRFASFPWSFFSSDGLEGRPGCFSSAGRWNHRISAVTTVFPVAARLCRQSVRTEEALFIRIYKQVQLPSLLLCVDANLKLFKCHHLQSQRNVLSADEAASSSTVSQIHN